MPRTTTLAISTPLSQLRNLAKLATPSMLWLGAGAVYYLAFRGPSLAQFSWVKAIGLSAVMPAAAIADLPWLNGFPSLVAAMSLALGLTRVIRWYTVPAALFALGYTIMNEVGQSMGLLNGYGSWLDVMSAATGLGLWLLVTPKAASSQATIGTWQANSMKSYLLTSTAIIGFHVLIALLSEGN